MFYFVLITILCLGLGFIGATLASDSENYESSTSPTYYDYMLNQKQKEAQKMSEFKEKISGTVTELKSNVNEPATAVKAATKDASSPTKDVAVLGSLYGTKGKLTIEKKSEKGEPSILGGITGVSDTQIFNPHVTSITKTEVVASTTSTAPTSPVVPTINCRTICNQTGYGTTCSEVCY